jgi:hypothetical protein
MADRRLDDVSANLGEVLRHADALLAEWSRFGDSVRAQVEREAAHIGRAVSDGTGAAVERAVRDQLASLARELAQLEQRVRVVSRGLGERPAHDRRLLGTIAGGIALAIVLLGVLLVLVVRGPAPLPASPVHVDGTAPSFGGAVGGAQVPVDELAKVPPDARPVDAAPPADAAPPPAAATRPVRRR